MLISPSSSVAGSTPRSPTPSSASSPSSPRTSTSPTSSQVVKNVASQSLEVKKLVFLYLLHYAVKDLEQVPEEEATKKDMNHKQVATAVHISKSDSVSVPAQVPFVTRPPAVNKPKYLVRKPCSLILTQLVVK